MWKFGGDKMDERITLKIKKLLELSNSSFEAEAKSALLKAQELMSQNNLQMADIESATLHKEHSAINTNIPFSKKRISTWEKAIVTVVSENFRCFPYITLDRINRQTLMNIIGMENDVEIAKQAIEFSLLSLSNCWKKYYENRKITIGKPSSRREIEMIKNDYMSEFIRGVESSFKKQVEEKSLVIIKDERVERKVKSLNLGHAKSPSMYSSGDTHARQSGYSDGNNINGGSRMLGN